MKKFLAILILICANKSTQAQMYWNQAAQFAGNSTSYISVENSASLNITGSFTFEAWVNPANTANKGVIAKGGALGTTLRYGIRINSSRVVLITNGSPKLSSKVTSLIPVNTWTHISASFNSVTNEYKIFINGMLDTASVIAGNPNSNTDSLFIGISGASTPLNGKLDEVRIWNRALSSDEVSRYMRTSLATSSGKYEGLMLSFTFQKKVNETPFTLKDQSGNLNHGNGRNITVVDQSYNPQHTISQNESVRFTGNNDYIAGADSPVLNLSQSFTIEFWIFPESNEPMSVLKKGNAYNFYIEDSRLKGTISGINVTSAGYLITLNQWIHFALSYDHSKNSVFYIINGTQVGVTNISLNVPSNTDSLLIGGGISENDFIGYIDEVRISQVPLSREDIKDYVNTSIDYKNDPFPSAVNLSYGFNGNLDDNTGVGGPGLHFRNNAGFSHPANNTDVPVSPVNRMENEIFQKGFYIRRPYINLPSFGNTTDEIRINFKESITDVNLFIALNHVNLSDLNIYLIAPNGESVRVAEWLTSGTSDNNLITIFDDNADSSLKNSVYNSFYTNIKPSENFSSEFNGIIPDGIWKLSINDIEAGNPGILYAWGIQINNHQERDKNLNVRFFIQGFYNPVTNLMISDTVIFNIMNKHSPYNLIESNKGVIDSTGLLRLSISGTGPVNVDSGYRFQILHRNTIESWSAGHFEFFDYESNMTLTGPGSILGSNVIQVNTSPNRYALYGGDVNQDDIIDATDAVAVDNDASNFTTGYVNTDVTGDDVVDAADALIVENNAANFVTAVTP